MPSVVSLVQLSLPSLSEISRPKSVGYHRHLLFPRKRAHHITMASSHFDIYNTTAVNLQEWQQSGKLTAVDIVETYLSQIDAHNVKGMGLRAVIDTAPRSLALERAKELDAERASKGSRGPLHGIPVLIKVSHSGLSVLVRGNYVIYNSGRTSSTPTRR